MMPRPPLGPVASARLDLVVQARDLSDDAAGAFCRAFSGAQPRRGPGALRLRGIDPAPAADRIEALAARWRCDAAIVPPDLNLSAFRVLALDMDSTLIGQECIDELARLAGRGEEVAAITAAAMRGEIADFSESLRRRVALLAGASASLLATVAEQRMQLNPGGERLLRAARHAGLRILLVTGGFGCFARALQARLGIDRICANELCIEDGQLTGQVSGPADAPERIVDAAGKAAALRELCGQIGCATGQSIGIGDGANDLPMLAAAGLSVAFHAKPKVRQLATYRLDYSDLDGVLNFFSSGVQGSDGA